MTTRTKAILSLSGVFLLGLLCGALALGLFVRDSVRDRERLRNSAGFSDYFADELSLTDGQRDSLKAELELAYREMADIRNQVESEYREVFDTLTRRMAPMLNASQRKALAEQRDRLLPKRERVEEPHNASPSVREIDRKVAESSSPTTATGSASSPQTPDRDSTREIGKERDISPTFQEGGEPDQAESVSTGDSLLTLDTREEQLPRIIAHMKKRLNLTEEQTGKIQELIRKGVRRNAWIRQNFADQPLVRGRRLRQSFRLLDRQILDLLTEEQLKVYDGMKKWMRPEKKKEQK